MSAKPSRSSSVEEQLEIYFLLVEMADRVSQRRQSANAFYLSVNTAVIGGASIGVVNGALWSSLAPVSIAGILICLLWIRSIRSYKNLNAAKFRIITEIERNFSVQPFKDEWDILDQNGDGVKHKPFHSTEVMVPFVFIFVHFSQFITLFQWSEGLKRIRDFLM